MKVKDVISTPEWDFVCIETEFYSRPTVEEIITIIRKFVGYCIIDGEDGGLAFDIFIKQNVPDQTLLYIFGDLVVFDADNMATKRIAAESSINRIKNTLKKFMD